MQPKTTQLFALWCAQRVEQTIPLCAPLIKALGEYLDGTASANDLSRSASDTEGLYADFYQISFGVTGNGIDDDYQKVAIAYAYSCVQNAVSCALTGQDHFAFVGSNDAASVASSKAGSGLSYDPTFDARLPREGDKCRQAVKMAAYHTEKLAIDAQRAAMQSA